MPEPTAPPNLRFLGGLVVVLLLAVTFLLGCFRQIDTDIWWHLKTGQEILRLGQVPRSDWFTFTSMDRRWIDLHWLFQITAAQLFSVGGMRLLTLCSATLGAAAVAILLFARRPGWPIAVQVAAWLPAIFLLTGRMYVRPEVVTLSCMAAFFTILFHAEFRPWLLWLLLPIQILWVNVQGLFVLGLVLFGAFWLDGAWRHLRQQPRAHLLRRTLFGMALVAACIANPYKITGLLFPLELFRKISWDAEFYSAHIGELQSLRQFIISAGIRHFYVLLQLSLVGLGVASFVLAWTRTRLDLFRLFTFLAFTWLSLQATRNSGQFALVAGAVTAWNLAEWAASGKSREGRESEESRERRVKGRTPTESVTLRAESEEPTARAGSRLSTLRSRLALVALAVSLLVAVWFVASGGFYTLAGEGRLVGLGEQPYWHGHEAARFAAQPGMPDRLIAFHLGHAAIFEFYKRDEQRTFCDPRLEVVSRAVLEEYHEIERAIAANRPGWQRRLAEYGVEMALVDHRSHHELEATLLTDPDWRCVHFDPVASVFLRSERAGSQFPAVDFARWHFETTSGDDAWTRADGQSAGSSPVSRLIGDRPTGHEPVRDFIVAEALYKLSRDLHERANDLDLKRTLAQLCFDHARRGATQYAAAVEGWRFMALGLLLQLDDPPVPIDLPPESLIDGSSVELLGLARVKYLLLAAIEADPSDFATLSTQFALAGLEHDAHEQVNYARKIVRRRTRNERERTTRQGVLAKLADLAHEARLEDAAQFEATVWKSDLKQLERNVREHLSRGWFRAALREFNALENEYDGIPLALLDTLGGLVLRVGGPAEARAFWERRGARGFDESWRQERIAATYWIECDYDAAIEHYRNSLALDPNRPGARWGLTRCYLEIGDAAGVLREAESALAGESLGFDRRRQVEWMRDLARPFAK